MQCELCGGLVAWRGPLSALTHTECTNCGGMNCQIPEIVVEDECRPDLIVGHSEMHGGWCVYEQIGYAEYSVRRGPFPSEDQANAELAELSAEA